eukprot:m.309818 g.309818  ORF g.309818 m.309818 type:complete len:80 (+) comp48059_c0_seq1:21-260(+)
MTSKERPFNVPKKTLARQSEQSMHPSGSYIIPTTLHRPPPSKTVIKKDPKKTEKPPKQGNPKIGTSGKNSKIAWLKSKL